MINICFISDTHTYLGKILDNLPDADVLVHCGDFLSRGSIEEFARFVNTLKNVHSKYKVILVTPGNHDKICQREPNLCKEMFLDIPNGHFLIDEPYVYKGIKFYLSPWTPEFFYWAFMYGKGEGKKIWSRIPDDTDILVTHGMPYRIMDEVEVLIDGEVDPHVGCKDLRERIKEVKPLVYAGGHLHFSGGKIMKEDGTLFINAAICDEQYIPNRKPRVIRINEETKEVKF